MISFVPGIGDVNVMNVSDFVMAMSSEESVFSDWGAFSCGPIAVLECASAAQAWMPSYHVC